MLKILLALSLFVASDILLSQQALSNDAVVKLEKAGLSDDLIVTTINASPGTYDTSPDGLIALKAAGVSDKVVAAVVAKAAPAPPATPKPDAPADSPTPKQKQYHGTLLPGS